MTTEVGLGNIPSANATSTTTTESNNELGQDAFLELLLTQIQNQNPLDPSDPSEFLSQLASFTSLEQMGQISDGIEGLAVLQATGLSLQNVDLVGRTVVHESASNAVTDGEASFRFNLPASADRVVIEYNDGGTKRTREISALRQGNNDFTLTDLDGDTVQIESIKAYKGDEPVDVSIKTYAIAKVEGLTFEGGTPMLMIGPTLRVDPSAVLEILEDANK